MKNILIALLICGCATALHAKQQEPLLILVPQSVGDMSSIKESAIETEYFTYSPCADGMVQHAAYEDGCINTLLNSIDTKSIGLQRIYHKGNELSKSKDWSIDPDHPDTVIHVHKKYLVYTSQTKQRVVPR